MASTLKGFVFICMGAFGAILLPNREFKAPIKPVDTIGELSQQALSAVSRLAARLSDEDPNIRCEAARSLTFVLEGWQRSLKATCETPVKYETYNPLGYAATMLGKMCPSAAIPLLVSKLGIHDHKLYGSSVGSMEDYPCAAALCVIGPSVVPELMRCFGSTPSQDISDKEVELAARVLTRIYHGHVASEEILFATLEIEKKHARTTENLDRLEAKLKEIVPWKQ